jgi:hypothetical protein
VAAAAASSSQPHVHDDYAAHHCPRPPSLHPKIDLHTHILPEHLPDLAERYGYGEWIRLEHAKGAGAHSCCAAMYKGQKFFRQVEANCFRAEERIKDMDEQHINVRMRVRCVLRGAEPLCISLSLSAHHQAHPRSLVPCSVRFWFRCKFCRLYL